MGSATLDSKSLHHHLSASHLHQPSPHVSLAVGAQSVAAAGLLDVLPGGSNNAAISAAPLNYYSELAPVGSAHIQSLTGGGGAAVGLTAHCSSKVSSSIPRLTVACGRYSLCR